MAVFLEHRHDTGKRVDSGAWEFVEGVEMRPRNAATDRVIRWPEQHDERGIEENCNCSLRS
ncbi:hypothetical protein [Sorangium sp. So ce1151]|uniref:hypothetical protein n=1 Tax=Sorangium sp. So ce1151 TaxID=3133332 RepID=UPI003F601EC2